jgi:hypothetical protein
MSETLTEGRDYYTEAGLFVLTADYLRRRGFCCQNGCRHCPYGYHEGNADGPRERLPSPTTPPPDDP